MTRPLGPRPAVALALFGLLLAASGCSQPKGTVSGKVTHNNKPVVWGTVTLIASDNLPYAAQIKPDGTYSVANVPSGAVKIGVTSPNPDTSGRPGAENTGGADSGPPKPPPGAWFALPDKYSDPLKSELTGTVKGDTVIDIVIP